MICAYDKNYLGAARVVLARMLDFAVHELKYDAGKFFDLFLSSGLAKRFGEGDFTLLTGMSGVELAYKVLETSGIETKRRAPKYPVDRSPEYWCGWALCYYQWRTSMSFAEIVKCVPIKDMILMYSPFHEMDIRHFCDRMDELVRMALPETKLKRLRLRLGLSQSRLAERAAVPLRTIQQYEQRQKDIAKAQAETVLKLSRALFCRMEDLI